MATFEEIRLRRQRERRETRSLGTPKRHPEPDGFLTGRTDAQVARSLRKRERLAEARIRHCLDEQRRMIHVNSLKRREF